MRTPVSSASAPRPRSRSLARRALARRVVLVAAALAASTLAITAPAGAQVLPTPDGGSPGVKPKPAATKPAADKPAADKPAATKPVTDKPADKPAATKPAGGGGAAPATGAAGAETGAPRREADPMGSDPFRAAPGDAAGGAGAAGGAVLAPPPPPPWTSAPTSASGAQLMPPSGAAGASPATTAPALATSADADARLRALEAHVAAEEEERRRDSEKLEWLRRVKLGAYVQPQLILQSFNAAASPNAGATGLPPTIGQNATIARADGTTTNPNFFRIRRARVKLEAMPTDYARLVFEIDPNLSGGPAAGTGTIARNVEAVGIARWCSCMQTDFGMGIFKVPFGFEVLQSDTDRPFIERSWWEQNLIPAEFDTGVRAYTTRTDKKLAVQLAVVNGSTIGEKNFAVVPDLSKGKDVVGRVSWDFGPADVGASAMYGQGQTVDATRLRYKQYPRWGVNLEAAFHHTFDKRVGATRAFGELAFARNLDRGTKYAFALPEIPAAIGDDVRNQSERGLSLRVEQDVTEWVTLGARYDMYTPDAGEKNDARDTYSFVGVLHFTKGLQLMAELDHAIDNVHRPGAPPPSKRIDTFSSVLQVRF